MTNAQEYWNREGARLLNPDNSLPTVEERVKAAFEAGVKAVYQNILDNERQAEQKRRDYFFSTFNLANTES